MAATKRVGEGVYAFPDGAQVRWAWVDRGRGLERRGWHLIDPQGEWVNTFWTKAEAVDAYKPSGPQPGDRYGRKGIIRGVVDRGDHWLVSVSVRGTKLKSVHNIEKKES